MDSSRTAVMAVGVNLIAVWVVAAAGGRATPQVPPHAAARLTQEQAVDEARGTLRAATARLKAHRRQPPDLRSVARDPFQFGARRPDARAAAPAGPAAGAAGTSRPPALEPAAPEIVLQGLAEDHAGGTVVRTAILSAGGDLVLATLGMPVGSRYRVVAIGADHVELEDAAGGPRLTLWLR